jgi:hypothetical protein
MILLLGNDNYTELFLYNENNFVSFDFEFLWSGNFTNLFVLAIIYFFTNSRSLSLSKMYT